ncbi:hypothetical protein [Mammaliicoccus sciuri]|uniref:hypothetical protein n=1 Tax=Mammaliicoccus sciuri TaxID=1296 RepID=UPI002DBFC318|nr:hypothetical protein [Mammaliicoccus sciuri]MEB7735296.1 hypothetical protein [Mammaliicoccus sciuri]
MIEIAGLSNGNNKKYGDSYGQWRDYNKDAKNTFHILPSGIKKYLPYFDGKAMNLYLFYCLNSRNDTGESWYSTKKCAEELEVTVRSINNWNTILEDIGLIVRAANNHTSKSTFLLPLSSYVVKEDEIGVTDFVRDYNQNNYKRITDGKLVSVINLFQWRKNSETKFYDVPYNIICLGFERTHYYDRAQKDFTVRKFVLLGENNINQEIDFKSSEFTKNVYRIDSGDNIKTIFREKNVTLDQDVVIGNMAISSNINLKDEFKKEVLELLDVICENRDKLEEVDIVE